MDTLSIILIGVALSMDAMAVALSSGISLPKVKLESAVRLAVFFGFFQFAMPVLGFFLARGISGYIEAVDHWIAFGLLAFLGIRMIFEALKKDSSGQSSASDPFCTKTLFIMAIATSIDALAVGVSFAITNVRIWAAAGLIGITTFILSLLGVYIGKKVGTLFKTGAEVLGGVILIGIGIKILLEHLLA